jgi:hypothetical protein
MAYPQSSATQRVAFPSFCARRSDNTEATSTRLGASVDPTDARCAAGFGPDDCLVRRGGNRTRRSSEVHPWDRTDQGPALWSGDSLGLTMGDGPIPCSRGCHPCAIRGRRRSGRVYTLRRGSFGSRKRWRLDQHTTWLIMTRNLSRILRFEPALGLIGVPGLGGVAADHQRIRRGDDEARGRSREAVLRGPPMSRS